MGLSAISRGVPLTTSNPNPDGYINPILEWDTNNPIDGIAWSASGFGKDNHLFGAVYGILDTGPESLEPTWPAILDESTWLAARAKLGRTAVELESAARLPAGTDMSCQDGDRRSPSASVEPPA